MLKHSHKGLCVFLLAFALLSSMAVLAADPGHTAGSVGPGTFESGNYSFPDSLTVSKYLILNSLTGCDSILTDGSGVFFCGINQTQAAIDYINNQGYLDSATLNASYLLIGQNETYNSTYNTWAYNQTTPAISYSDAQGYLTSSGANLTYLFVGENQTNTDWTNVLFSNDTLMNSTYVRLDDINNSYASNSSLGTYDTWAYNMTTPAISYADASFITSANLNASYLLVGENLSASAGMDYTNIAMTNQSNTFAAGYNQTFDTNTLFIDAGSHSVGIGTANPGYKLHVVSSNSGDTARFEGNGVARIEIVPSVGGQAQLRFMNGTNGLWMVYSDGNTDSLYIFHEAGVGNFIIPSSNVSIGTLTLPTQTLDVAGNINVSGVTPYVYFGGGGYVYDNGTTLILGHA